MKEKDNVKKTPHTSIDNIRRRTFKKKDYSAGDGMLTAVWGPGMWHFLHTMSFNYPVNPTPDDKKHYKDFMLSMQYVLPCKYCRQNIANTFKEHPISDDNMKNRDNFSRYVYNLHETINKRLKKKSNLTYCDVRERYEHFRARCVQDLPKLFNPNDSIKFEEYAINTQTRKNKNNNKKNKKNDKGETGCTEPLYGEKSKCIIKIVPQEEKCKTLQIDKKCLKTRLE